MKIKCLEKVSRKSLYIAVSVLLIVVTLLVAAVVILLILATRNSSGSAGGAHEAAKDQIIPVKQSWSDPLRPRDCAKTEYLQPQPPLLIISLSGLTKSLVSESFPTLLEVDNFGVSTKAVLLCFPSYNVTNKLAIATGLFPQAQYFDPDNAGAAFNGSDFRAKQPIWLAFKGQTNGITALHSWPLHPFENADHPDYYIPRNSSVSFEEQLNMALNWLKMDSTVRPGLIMVSCDEIQEAFRTNADESMMRELLSKLDRSLSSFFTQLYDEALLDCVNIAIVSDEGIYNGTTRINLQHSDNLRSYDPGTVTVISTGGSDTTNLTSSLSCRKDDAIRVFQPSTMPTRWHYGDTDGDIIILARRGMEKCRSCKRKKESVFSGYDYLDESKQTVFYAQGPSFKSGAVLPPFQNVEYMNLWLDLLNMHYVPNNGSVGFMNEALTKPIKRERSRRFGIRECPFTHEERAINCGGCTALQQVRVANWMNSCTQPNRPIVMLSSASPLLCYQKICEKLIIRGTSGDESRALVELFHSNNTLARSQTQCLFVSSRYEFQCPSLSVPEGQELHSLSANPKKVLARIATVHVPWNALFVKDVLKPLNDYTLAISRELGRVISITGTAFDRNFDGLADEDKTGSPTHLYRVLITCTSGWSADGFACRNPWSTRVIAFIFPHMDGDINCLPSRELLLQYTARLRDVELITGMDIDLPGVPASHALHLKINVVTQLW
ncbi:type I phosphodiesterase / nucleotide pyrophosphatase [Ancylostoma caninum]|uniref:Type I phosphodiesterase / nucleotide pyrophosphatase n=1 Tax=Ancylostoma caninum TaxID=29170 RepID=A0A368GJY6_ANCCA|nr:type I phosphodiesterase / nucleotide pyrophosphatase [Ancylostoma caninum]